MALAPRATVVDVHVASLRAAGYRDLKAWMADSEHNVYVGRRGIVFIDGARFPPMASPFANPYKVRAIISDTNGVQSDGREEAIRNYEVYIREQLARDAELRAQLRAMRGKRLGCWCAPLPCHADVLVRIIEELNA